MSDPQSRPSPSDDRAAPSPAPSPATSPTRNDQHSGAASQVTNSELVHLRIRVIALENMIIAMLAQGSDDQLQIAREMAQYITPRPGATEHPLTLQAANHMTDFVDRAIHFRSTTSQNK